MSICPFLFILLQTTLVAASLFDPHSKYQTPRITFWHGIDTRAKLDQFITSEGFIAREQVVISDGFPITAVLKRPSNPFSLFDALKYIQNYQINEVVLLEFRTKEDLNSARWTLNFYNKKWIWIQVALVQGPHGRAPNITSADIQELMVKGMGRHNWWVFEITTKPKPPYGYTDKQFKDIHKKLAQGKVSESTALLLLDIIHTQNSKNIPKELVNKLRYIILEQKPGTNLKEIYPKKVADFIDGIGAQKVYLDVQEDLRDVILKELS